MQPYLVYWLAAYFLPGVSAKKILSWLAFFSDISHLFNASLDEWLSYGLSKENFLLLKNLPNAMIDAALNWRDAHIARHIITYVDDDYPPSLKQLPDPPLILFAEGQVELLRREQMAIVGARNASPLGLENAYQFAQQLAQTGLVITSGLARGIDSAAHAGAISMPTGKTIAILGSGLCNIYPRQNYKLAQHISQQGLVLSEFSLTEPPNAYNFPRRNRLIAQLSIGILVVEAALKSGSLITARLGLELGKEIFALPGSIHHPLAKGCHQLLKQGAQLVETAQDILEAFPAWSNIKQIAAIAVNEPLSPKLQQFLSTIDYAVTTIDMIISRSQLTSSMVSSMLLTLELAGYVQSTAGGYIRLAN